MAKQVLQEIIREFAPEKFIHFFRSKNAAFRDCGEPASEYNDNQFTDAFFIGEIPFNSTDKLVVYSFKTNRNLTERSGKKAQYEKGKRILKDTYADGGIFIFYDENGNFRFSLIFIEYSATRKKYSYFKRYTFFVSPCLTNKTFLTQIGEADFSSLDTIKEAFSVEPVTKQFYNELQSWYFYVMDKIRFPEDYKYSNDPEKNREIRNATNLIRLITRIIFIWFMKEKELVPSSLFSSTKMKSIVRDFMKDNNSSNYYNAILQNLFFATLNQKMNERKFVTDDGYPSNRKEYGIKNLFRYADMFLISKEEALSLFKDIPFLNGGLFDCLDKEDEKGKVVYVDGFSRNPKKRAVIPDYLFFQKDEQRVDLSAYGVGTNKIFRGLIEILNSYNFTIDENTPIDQEVALDPELLGKVFENLLASYNPETATTARKATGSYYTPREIVDYMVEESIYEYIKTLFNDIDEDKVRMLLSYSDEVPEFSDEEKKKIITAIDNTRILDPACGSGAFLMGILYKLVHVLQRLDPENQYWYELQYQKALKKSEEVFKRDNKIEREEMLRDINETFDESINYPDFARKLYLIENCIYGVDIQPIAIQIAKLRFFISLVLDQKVDKTKENLGIKALPNLETKFVSANVLISLEKSSEASIISGNEDIKKIEQELENLRHRYFQARTRAEKLRLQKKDKKLRETLAEKLEKLGYTHSAAEKIAHFDLFDQNASADWFDPEWMFGVRDGFDIVIGNPPYVRQEKIKPLKPILRNQCYQIYTSTADLYTYFYERCYQLLKPEGILCFISSNKWMRTQYGKNLRRFLKENTCILNIIDFSGHSVFEQTVDTNIILFRKKIADDNHRLSFSIIDNKIDGDIIAHIKQSQNSIPQKSLSTSVWTLADERVLRLKEKIERIGKPLKEWDVKIYRGVLTGYNKAFIIDTETKEQILKGCRTEKERRLTEEIIRPVLRGRDIERYYYRWAGLWLIKIESGWTDRHRNTENPETFFKNTLPSLYEHLISFADTKGKGKGLLDRDDQGDYWWELRDCDYYNEFEREKIIYPEFSSVASFTYDTKQHFILDTGWIIVGENLKFILGVINSNLCWHYISSIVTNLSESAFRMKKLYIEQLPIPPITPQNKSIAWEIESLVDNILRTKEKKPETNTSDIEKQIDIMVYNFYNLKEVQ